MNQLELHVQSKVRTARANIELFSNSNLIQKYVTTKDEAVRYALMQPALLRLFSSYQKAYPDYYEISFLLPDGYEDTRSSVTSIPNIQEQEAYSPYFQEMAESEDNIFTTFYRNPDNDQVTLLISKKLMVLDDEHDPILGKPPFRGYLAVMIDLGFLKQQVKNNRIGKKGFIFFTTGHGSIVFHPDETQLKKTLPSVLFKQLLQCAKAGTSVKTEYNGQLFIFRGKHLHPRLFLFAALAEDELVAASRNLGMIVAGITLAAIVITLSLIFLALKFLVISPIHQLNRAVQDVGKGDLNINLNTSRNDEISTLATEFNLMTDKLGKITVSRDYVDSILRSMKDALLVVSPDGRIQTVNTATCSLLEYEEKELIGQPISMILSESESVSINDVIKKNYIDNAEKTFRTKNNRNVPVLFSSSGMYDDKNKVQRIICVAKDITAQRNMEIQLRQTQKLEALGTLAGGIAHDFNNILMSMMLNTEIALRGLKGNISARGALEITNKAGNRAKELIEQILTFSRKSKQERFPIMVSPLIKESLKMLRSSLPATIEIHQDIKTESDTVFAAPTEIQQILINLCTNAAHAMREDGGHLTISLVEEYIDSDADLIHPDLKAGHYLRLSVTDTGHGMSHEVIEKIFDPFLTLKKAGEGTGLGLSVVHGIVKGMGGAIKVESKPGKGAVFDVFLPRVEGEKTAAAETFHAIPKGIGRILIVDDEEYLLESLQRSMRSFGYHVHSKRSGSEVLELFKKAPEEFDLVVTDLIMPRMTGLELARELLSIRPDIPIILCTGFSDETTTEQCEAIGIRELVNKPVNGAELARIIDNILSGG